MVSLLLNDEPQFVVQPAPTLHDYLSADLVGMPSHRIPSKFINKDQIPSNSLRD